MIELQKLVDKIEKEFDLKFLVDVDDKDYRYVEEGSSIFDWFSLDKYGQPIIVKVRLSHMFKVEINHTLFYDHEIDEFMYRLKNVVWGLIA